MGNSWTALALLALLLMVPAVPARAEEGCNTPGNLTTNCNFDHWTTQPDGKITPQGWAPWVLMGSPAFDIDDHGSAPGAPAQRIWSDGGVWTAGLLQQVPVTPNKWYETKIDWAAPDCPNIERKIGIDPTGGSDPASPAVVWSASSWEEVRMPDLRVSAFAPGGMVTVFVWTHHGMSYGQDQVFLDAVTLVENPSLAPPTPAATATPLPPTPRPPTATPRPATATPPPTETPVEVAALVDTAPITPTAELPTDTPTPSPTDTPLPTDTPAPTPTFTATPTRTPVPVAMVRATDPVLDRTRDQASRPTQAGRSLANVLPLVAAVAAGGALLLGLVIVGLVLRARSQEGAESPEDH